MLYDAYSNYPEVAQLRDTSSRTVIDNMASIFSRHGIPVKVHSDGGSQFASREFAEFAERYDFAHVVSSPRFPRSNGLAEKGVQVVKRLIKKCAHSGEDFWLALLTYRASPLENEASPAELLMNRRLRTLIPDFSVKPSRRVRKHPQNKLRGRDLSPLRDGEVVRIHDGQSWSTKAKVLRAVGPRSYMLETEHGRRLRRNRQHLRRTAESFSSCDSDSPSQSDGYDTADDDEALLQQCQTSSPVHLQQAEYEGTQQGDTTVRGLRRSSREVQPPLRLGYNEDFSQMNV